MFPEALEAGRWDEIDQSQHRAKLAQIAQDVAFLRGADFDALAGAGRFTLNVGLPVEAAEEGADKTGSKKDSRTFAQLVDGTLKSDLARDLDE